MDTDVPGSAGPVPKNRTALFRRRRRIVLTGLLSGLTVAVAALATLPSPHTATVSVQVRPTGAAETGRAPADGLDLEAQARLATSEHTTELLSETLSERADISLSPTELADRVEVSVPSDGDVLEFRFSAPTPEEARAGADALAEAYLLSRAREAETLLATRVSTLRDEQAALYAELDEAGREDAPRTDALEQEITGLGRVAASLTALSQTVDPGKVVGPASTPGSVLSAPAVLWAAGGPALGLVLGLAAAFLRDRSDPLVRDGEQAARLAGRPVLVELPAPAHLDELPCEPFEQHTRAGQKANACAHLLRSRLRTARSGDEGSVELTDTSAGGSAKSSRTVLVTSVTPGRSGPRAAVDLASALARTGSETLLVCTDPSPDPFGLPEGPGLAEALTEGEDPGALTVRPDSLPLLRVLRHGRPGSAAPVQGTVMHDLLELLLHDSDHTVLTSTAGTGRADVESLLGAADALVPVVELGRSRRDDLAALVRAAELTGTVVPGVVVLTHGAASRTPAPSPVASGTVPACRVAEHDRTRVPTADGTEQNTGPADEEPVGGSAPGAASGAGR
ncbi:hypothetical protein [Nocardiopsis kunsanensis]|uniref:Lipopolysaccharide biosynthesis protein n=1 Tax=Nocardiopsis kunsanensis TaxID=141693 RepID=A0A918X9Z3_9ACTN|nr:hypothetical protein [Nocardiopsis kunsanensis]GHD19122.1 hypothetical protein GCM10007147_10000 [Nocardiopsis kunsanensis]